MWLLYESLRFCVIALTDNQTIFGFGIDHSTLKDNYYQGSRFLYHYEKSINRYLMRNVLFRTRLKSNG